MPSKNVPNSHKFSPLHNLPLPSSLGLDSILMGSGDIAASPEELKRQLEALKALEVGLFAVRSK